MNIAIYGRQGRRNNVRVGVFQIDPEDEALALAHRWYLGGRQRRYVVTRTPRGATLLLHRLLLEAQAGQRVVHRNGNQLDNRRENLVLREWP